MCGRFRLNVFLGEGGGLPFSPTVMGMLTSR